MRGWSDDKTQQVPAGTARASGAVVIEHRGEHPSGWAAMGSIVSKFGMTAETLRIWVRRAEVDGGTRPEGHGPIVSNAPDLCPTLLGRPSSENCVAPAVAHWEAGGINTDRPEPREIGGFDSEAQPSARNLSPPTG